MGAPAVGQPSGLLVNVILTHRSPQEASLGVEVFLRALALCFSLYGVLWALFLT